VSVRLDLLSVDNIITQATTSFKRNMPRRVTLHQVFWKSQSKSHNTQQVEHYW